MRRFRKTLLRAGAAATQAGGVLAADDTHLVLWTCNGGTNQQWHLP